MATEKELTTLRINTVPNQTVYDAMAAQGLISNEELYLVGGNVGVSSVNGKDGDVTLDADDVGALPSSTTYVSTVDGASGAVTTNAVKYTTQSLTNAQKQQARTNIGAGTSNFDGDYNSLSNQPTIPTVNNGTLTIQQNGTTKGTFTANSSTNVTANITVPTQTSDLTNDSGFITSANAPVRSVNTKTGAVVLTQDDVGDGTTYVRTHNDFTTALKNQIGTNEDNIAMLDSDVESLQTDVGTLKTNVGTIQTALSSKQDSITGGASTITDDNLTANRALVSNSSGKVAVSAVTSTELGYLDGVTSNIQTQLNSKLSSAPVTSVNSKTGAVTLGASDVGAVPTTRTVNGKALSSNITLSASDVGALPSTTSIPSATSDLTNDSGYVAIVMQATQPTGQSGGDFWYRTITE